MNIVYINETQETQAGNVNVVRHSLAEIESGCPDNIDIFLLDARDRKYAEDGLRAIRTQSAPSVYLRPVVAVNTDVDNDALIRAMADALFSEAATASLELSRITEAGVKINRRIEKLTEIHDTTDTAIAQKVLRYIYTRQKELKPYRDVLSRFGLHYPDIETFLNSRDDSLFYILDFLENQHLLHSEFYEKIHQCNQCSSSLLNFIEICPHCGSGDLEDDALIHHFHCAHVAPAETFRHKNGYVCPKCDKPLGGLGVDYDKPSMVYRCNSCRHVCQEPDVSTTCYNCGTKSLPEDLILRTVKTYRLSALGENSAVHGIDIMFQQIFDKSVKMIPYPSFKTFLEAEIERIKRYKISKTSIFLFHIGEFEKMFSQLGNRTKEIFAEMGMIMKSVLRTSDITTVINEETFICLLPETNIDGALMAIKRLKEKFFNLFETNLHITIDIFSKAVEISPTHTVDTLISEITDDGNPDRNL